MTSVLLKPLPQGKAARGHVARPRPPAGRRGFILKAADQTGFRLQLTMGTFFVKCKIENIVDRNKSVLIPKMLVDSGSEYTWIPAMTLEKIEVEREKKDLPFVMANGQHVTRSVGFAIIRFDKYFTVDEVVFAEKGDLLLLGARTLEGLSLVVDPRRKKLVASGAIPAA